MKLINEINGLKNGSVGETARKRLKEFKNCEDWFSELCFCILTANSKAETALKIQKEVGCDFAKLPEAKLSKIIKKNKHRFHNNKAKYIVEARKFENIKNMKFDNSFEFREFLVKNVKGLGYKEASHFLRNVGYTDLAILDRHILNVMKENGLIKEKPLPLNKKRYLEIEGKFAGFADKMNVNLAELDLYFWYMKTGKVLK